MELADLDGAGKRSPKSGQSLLVCAARKESIEEAVRFREGGISRLV